MPRTPPPAPVRRTVLSGPDHTFLLGCKGAKFASIGLPSGAVIEAVDGHQWRVVVLDGPTGERYPVAELEAKQSGKERP